MRQSGEREDWNSLEIDLNYFKVSFTAKVGGGQRARAQPHLSTCQKKPSLSGSNLRSQIFIFFVFVASIVLNEMFYYNHI